jgi:pantothenate synthetase
MDQVQILSAVCKKLNNDIEALANQTSIRESTLAKLDANQQTFDEQLRQLNMDIQIKLSKTDTIVQKLQSDVEQMSHGVRDVLNSQQDTNRLNIQRYQELKLEVKTKKKMKILFGKKYYFIF